MPVSLELTGGTTTSILLRTHVAATAVILARSIDRANLIPTSRYRDTHRLIVSNYGTSLARSFLEPIAKFREQRIGTAVEHANRIRDAAIRRRSILASINAIRDYHRDDMDPRETQSREISEMESISPPNENRVQLTGEAARQRIDDARDGTTARGLIPTGVVGLDEQFEMMSAGSLTTLAAKTSIGKTQFALQILQACSRRGIPSLILSLEMSAGELSDRYSASLHRSILRRFGRAQVSCHPKRGSSLRRLLRPLQSGRSPFGMPPTYPSRNLKRWRASGNLRASKNAA